MYKIFFIGLFLSIFAFTGCTSARVNNNSPNKPTIKGKTEDKGALSSKKGIATDVKSDSKVSEETKLMAELYSLRNRLSKCGVTVEIYADTNLKNQRNFMRNLIKGCNKINSYAKGYILHASRVKTKKGYRVNNHLFLPYDFSTKELLALVKHIPVETTTKNVKKVVEKKTRPNKPLW